MIINPIYIYLINVCDVLHVWFAATGTILSAGGIILACSTLDIYEEDDITKFRKTAKKLLISGIILIALAILLPTRETSYTMLIASQVTITNIEAATNAAKECIDYIAKVLK